MDQKTIDAFVEIISSTIDKKIEAFRQSFEVEARRTIIHAVRSAVQKDMTTWAAEMDARMLKAKPRDGVDGADATPEMVAKAVADHMQAHPIVVPEPLAPTDEQLDAAVAKHFEGFTVEVPAPDPAMIAKAVEDHMQANPIIVPEPLSPTDEQVFAMVAKHMTDNPITVPTPSPEMIAKAVADHLQANPVPVPDAPAPLAPTDEQVARVVAKHMTENPPEPGARGLDAIELNILPSINPQRRYAKGTYAQHDGGILRATRDTDPGDPLQSGWDVVLRGVSAIEVHPLGGAEFAIKSLLTGGQSHITKLVAPTFAESYRDVWRESAGEYQRGDMVTHKGSVWLAKQATTERPGTGDGWKLIVKAGKDGKDLNVVKLERPAVYKLEGQP